MIRSGDVAAGVAVEDKYDPEVKSLLDYKFPAENGTWYLVLGTWQRHDSQTAMLAAR
jgi:hypothetical protein